MASGIVRPRRAHVPLRQGAGELADRLARRRLLEQWLDRPAEALPAQLERLGVRRLVQFLGEQGGVRLLVEQPQQPRLPVCPVLRGDARHVGVRQEVQHLQALDSA